MGVADMQTKANAGLGGVGPARDAHALKPKVVETPWEIVHPEIPFMIRTKRPAVTIKKLLKRFPYSGMWVWPGKGYFYIAMDAEIYNKLRNGKSANTIYTLSPGARGQAWGKITLYPGFLFEVEDDE